jgi:hypothetical protein
MIAGYCGKSGALDDAFAKFVTSYARQTEDDYEALSQAKGHGGLKWQRS